MKRIRMTKEQLKIALITCGMIGASVGISNNTVGIFFNAVSASLGIHRGTLAMYPSIMYLTQAVSAAMVQKLIYRNDFVRTVRAAAMVCVAGTALLSRARSVVMFYALAAVIGFADGIFATGTVTTIVNNWFAAMSGTAVGVVMGFSGIACACFTPILSCCVQRLGWQAAYVADAGVILLLVLPALLLPFRISPVNAAAREKQRVPFRFRETTYLLLCIFTFNVTCLTGLTQHLSGYAVTIHMTELFGASMVSCVMTANTVSKFVTGFLSDRIGPIKASVIVICLNIAGICLFVAGRQYSGLLMPAAFLFGFLYGMTTVGISILTKYFFGEKAYATAFSVVYMCNLVGASLAIVIVGYVYDYTGSYLPALYGAVVIQIIDLALLMAVQASAVVKKRRDNRSLKQ